MIKNNEELKELVDSLPRNIVELSITVDKAGTYKIPVDSDIIIEALTYAVNEIDKLKAEKQKLVDMVEELVNKPAYQINIPDDLQNSGTRYFLAESTEHANQIVTRLKAFTKYPNAISVNETKWFRSFSEYDKAQQLLKEIEDE